MGLLHRQNATLNGPTHHRPPWTRSLTSNWLCSSTLKWSPICTSRLSSTLLRRRVQHTVKCTAIYRTHLSWPTSQFSSPRVPASVTHVDRAEENDGLHAQRADQLALLAMRGGRRLHTVCSAHRTRRAMEEGAKKAKNKTYGICMSRKDFVALLHDSRKVLYDESKYHLLSS